MYFDKKYQKIYKTSSSDKMLLRGVIMAVKIHLAEILGKQKMTQLELSKKTGIRPNTINELYWELVDRINPNHIELICKTLHCKVGESIEIDED